MPKLKEFRRYLRLNQGEMAEKLGITQASWSQYETGIRKTQPDVLQKLAEMGLDLNWLATGEGEMLRGYGVTPKLQQADLTPAQQYVQSRIEQAVPRTLPEHIQQAYIIVHEAVYAARADFATLDTKRIGLVIGIIAQEIALGKREEARAELLKQAGLLVGLKAHS